MNLKAFLALSIVVVGPTSALAWGATGHEWISGIAIEKLPDNVPAFGCRARSRALCRLGRRREGDGCPVAQGIAEHARGLRHGPAQEGGHTVQGGLSPLHHHRRLAADSKGLRILAGSDEGDRDGGDARRARLV